MKVDEGLVRPSVEQIDLRRMTFDTGAIVQQVKAIVDPSHDRCFSKTLRFSFGFRAHADDVLNYFIHIIACEQ